MRAISRAALHFHSWISFLGFVINALFDKIKITSVLLLMIVGLLIGPVFHLINSGVGSLIIASLLISYSFIVTGFVNAVFLLVLFTNIAFSIGVMYTCKPAVPIKVKAPAKAKAVAAPAKEATAP